MACRIKARSLQSVEFRVVRLPAEELLALVEVGSCVGVEPEGRPHWQASEPPSLHYKVQYEEETRHLARRNQIDFEYVKAEANIRRYLVNTIKEFYLLRIVHGWRAVRVTRCWHVIRTVLMVQ